MKLKTYLQSLNKMAEDYPETLDLEVKSFQGDSHGVFNREVRMGVTNIEQPLCSVFEVYLKPSYIKSMDGEFEDYVLLN